MQNQKIKTIFRPLLHCFYWVTEFLYKRNDDLKIRYIGYN